MASQNGPTETVKALVAEKGGSIWTSIVEPAAGGTGTTATNLTTTFRVPDAARMLLGWRPIDLPLAGAAAESSIAVFSIGGNNYNYQPQEVICGNVCDSVLLAGSIQPAPSEYYDVFAPVNGGEEWTVTVEPLDAIAGNRRSCAEFYWTDRKLDLPVIYSECSRETATVTTAAVTNGTTLNINNAHQLIEVGGVNTHATIAADEPAFGHFTLSCTALTPIQTIEFIQEPTGVIAATDQGAGGSVTRRPQRIRFSSDRASITCKFDQDQDLAAAGQFAHYIRWI